MKYRDRERDRWIPWYTKETARWLQLSPGAKGICVHIAMKLDERTGGWELSLGLHSLAVLLHTPWATLEPLLAELIAAGKLEWDEESRVLSDPQYVSRKRRGAADRVAEYRAKQKAARESSRDIRDETTLVGPVGHLGGTAEGATSDTTHAANVPNARSSQPERVTLVTSHPSHPVQCNERNVTRVTCNERNVTRVTSNERNVTRVTPLQSSLTADGADGPGDDDITVASSRSNAGRRTTGPIGAQKAFLGPVTGQETALSQTGLDKPAASIADDDVTQVMSRTEPPDGGVRELETSSEPDGATALARGYQLRSRSLEVREEDPEREETRVRDPRISSPRGVTTTIPPFSYQRNLPLESVEETQVRRKVDRRPDEIWDHYVATVKHYRPRRRPGALKPKDRDTIKALLKQGRTVEDLKRACSGLFRSPHHLGQNDRNTEYLEIEYALRKPDTFMALQDDAEPPPAAKSPEPPEEGYVDPALVAEMLAEIDRRYG